MSCSDFSVTVGKASFLPSHLPSFVLPLSRQIDRWGLKTFVDINKEPCIADAELFAAAKNSGALLNTNVNCQLADVVNCASIMCPECTLASFVDLDQSKRREWDNEGVEIVSRICSEGKNKDEGNAE